MPIYVNTPYRADLDIQQVDLLNWKDDSPDDVELLKLAEAFRRQWVVYWKNIFFRMMSLPKVDALFAIAEKWKWVNPDLPEEEFSATLLRQKEAVLPLIHRLIEVSTELTISEIPKHQLEEAEIRALDLVQKVSRVLGQWKQAAVYSDVLGGAVAGGIMVDCDHEGIHAVSMPHERNDRARQYWERFLNR